MPRGTSTRLKSFPPIPFRILHVRSRDALYIRLITKLKLLILTAVGCNIKDRAHDSTSDTEYEVLNLGKVCQVLVTI